MTETITMIQFNDVSLALGGRPVLDSLSLHLEEARTLALLGLSGSGKTTALKLICGLHRPDRGEVLVDGKSWPIHELSALRRRLGYVVQEGGLFPHLTAEENLFLVTREAGLSASAARVRMASLAELTHIDPALLRRYPRQLSGGQRQRVGLMRALLLDPPILLMDEPLGALDPITRRDLQDELKDMFARLRKTVVLVTHDIHEAAWLADEAVLLEEGRVAQAGPMWELLRAPAGDFAQRFVNAQRLPEVAP